jgi:hypothetical protein
LLTQDTCGSLPWPPAAWSLMLASRMAWNSGLYYCVTNWLATPVAPRRRSKGSGASV